MDPLYLIDGYGLFYRSYFAFAKSPMKNPYGVNVSAVFGFYRTLLSILKEYKPAHIAFVLDPEGPTFRSTIYPEYKATRQKTPDDLKAQFPVLDEVARGLNMPILRVQDYEADDVIATLATRCKAEGRPCFIISGDKDLMQLVDDKVSMLKPSRDGGFELVGPQEVMADKGIGPQGILDYLSLLGDSSDNVPGVPGVGEKTALKLLAEFGTLEDLYQRLSDVNPKGLQEKLRAGQDSAFLSKKLITLVCDVPGMTNIDLELLRPKNLDGYRAATILREQGLKVLAQDYEKFLGGGSSTAETQAQAADLDRGPQDQEADLPKPQELKVFDPWAVQYILVDTMEGLLAMVEELESREWLAFDTETEGLDVYTNPLCGLSFCAQKGRAFYVALRGQRSGVNTEQENLGLGLWNGEDSVETILAWEEVRPILARVLQKPSIKLIAQNAKFDWQVLHHNGLEPHGIAFDTMVAAWLVDSTRNLYNMDALSMDYLHYKPISFLDLFSAELRLRAKKEPNVMRFSSVPLEQASTYSAEDADVTFQLFQTLEPRIREKGLWSLLEEVEMPLIPILARMEYRGIGLDSKALAGFSAELEIRLAGIEKELYELVGHPFNINSTKQLQEVLFVERKLQSGKKTKTGFSTDISVLEELARQDPVPQKVLEHRSLSKLKGTYVDTLPTMVHPATGHIHTSFSQTGTATGRISSKDPNLQNIPVKDEDGRRIRMAFVADPGMVFVSADYSQVELVVMAHLADDPGLKEAFATGTDVHRLTASKLFAKPLDQVSSEERRLAKTINFGVLYGMSAFRLSNELGIPNRDAQAFIEAYFKTYPAIKAYIAKQVEACMEEGGVRTLLGRWRPIPAIHSANKTERQAAERVAVNTPIQGTAADIVKLAMIKLDTALTQEGLEARMVLQIHDELIIQCPTHELSRVKELCMATMHGAINLSVPLGVNVESSTRWGDMH